YAENFFENATPVWFRSLATADPEHYGFYGYIADDVAEIEPRLVKFKDYDEDGNELPKDEQEPEGFHYDRVPTMLHVILKKERRKRIELESRVDELEKQLKE